MWAVIIPDTSIHVVKNNFFRKIISFLHHTNHNGMVVLLLMMMMMMMKADLCERPRSAMYACNCPAVAQVGHHDLAVLRVDFLVGFDDHGSAECNSGCDCGVGSGRPGSPPRVGSSSMIDRRVVWHEMEYVIMMLNVNLAVVIVMGVVTLIKRQVAVLPVNSVAFP